METTEKAGCKVNERESSNGHCLWHKETSWNVCKEKDRRWGLGEAERNFMKELFQGMYMVHGLLSVPSGISHWAAGARGSFPGVSSGAQDKKPHDYGIEVRNYNKLQKEKSKRMKQKQNWKQ